MQEDGFPAVFDMVICILAASIPSWIINQVVGPQYFYVGPIVGAICGAVAIAFTTGMTLGRAAIAGLIYMVCMIGVAFMLRAMMA